MSNDIFLSNRIQNSLPRMLRELESLSRWFVALESAEEISKMQTAIIGEFSESFSTMGLTIIRRNRQSDTRRFGCIDP